MHWVELSLMLFFHPSILTLSRRMKSLLSSCHGKYLCTNPSLDYHYAHLISNVSLDGQRQEFLPTVNILQPCHPCPVSFFFFSWIKPAGLKFTPPSLEHDMFSFTIHCFCKPCETHAAIRDMNLITDFFFKTHSH